MNVFDPVPATPASERPMPNVEASSRTAPSFAAPDPGAPEATVQEPARQALRLLCSIALPLILCVLVLTTLAFGARLEPILPGLRLTPSPHATPWLVALRASSLLPPVFSALLVVLAGTGGAWIMASARARYIRPRDGKGHVHPRISPFFGHVPFIRRMSVASPLSPLAAKSSFVSRQARWPQCIVVGSLSVISLACAWMPPPWPVPELATPALGTWPNTEMLLGIAALLLDFPVLLAQRFVAAAPPAVLPEAVALRRLWLLLLLTLAAAGLLSIAAGIDLSFARRVAPLLAVVPSIVAAELLLRCVARCFLPLPPAHQARAVAESAVLRLVAETVFPSEASAGEKRRILGIDFGRSWALAYLRSATPALLLVLALLSWGLSGLVLVEGDQRAIYERFGAPVRVLHPGLHAILPWPLGTTRRVEFGTIHDVPLLATTAPTATPPGGAEELPPAETDRLWEQPHPGELVFLIASHDDRGDSFQVVSADIKLRYRVGLTDADALAAAYGVADPQATLRATAGQMIDRFLTGRTLNAVLGENREAMADHLRSVIQGELDHAGSGLDLTAVVIEAIHPPAGAAAAYHNVQAAEVQATSLVAEARGMALATAAKARMDAATMTTQAQATAAEAIGTASGDVTRLEADYAAAHAHETSFLLERRLAALAAALAKSPATILDHRLAASEPPVLDLRPMTTPAVRSAVPKD